MEDWAEIRRLHRSEGMPIKAIVQQPMFVMGVLYMALGVSLVARMLTVVTYRRLGSAVTGGMQYVENFLAITLPILLLNERMTIEMLLGGVLILLGGYFDGTTPSVAAQRSSLGGLLESAIVSE